MRTFDSSFNMADWFGSGCEVNAWLNRLYAGAGTAAFWLAAGLAAWITTRWIISGGLKPHLGRVQAACRIMSHRRAAERLARRRRALGQGRLAVLGLGTGGLS